MSNVFIAKTKAGLVLDENSEDFSRIAPRGFEITDSKKEDCILVIGLNPAGDNTDAAREKQNRTYLYSITGNKVKVDSKWLYNKYYRPIYEFAKEVVEDNVKWPWCNKDWDTLEKEIDGSELSPFKDILIKEYDNHKGHTCTIYIGDMFYYHETSSKELPLNKGYKGGLEGYSMEMLEMHIAALRDANKNIKFVYINNAQVSHWLCGDKTMTAGQVDGVKVFYGGMLSGARSLDGFSRKRLVNEIQKNMP